MIVRIHRNEGFAKASKVRANNTEHGCQQMSDPGPGDMCAWMTMQQQNRGALSPMPNPHGAATDFDTIKDKILEHGGSPLSEINAHQRQTVSRI